MSKANKGFTYYVDGKEIYTAPNSEHDELLKVMRTGELPTVIGINPRKPIKQRKKK